MRITKWGEYGVLCSLYLAHCFNKEPRPIGASEIAEVQDIPLQYTQQILQRLRKGDIIESIRGPHGGYRLTRTPDEISMKDILTAAEGVTFEVICEVAPVYEKNCGATGNCGLGRVWSELREHIDSYLGSKTLSAVLENHKIVNRSEQRLKGEQTDSESCGFCCSDKPEDEESLVESPSANHSDAS